MGVMMTAYTRTRLAASWWELRALRLEIAARGRVNPGRVALGLLWLSAAAVAGVLAVLASITRRWR